MSACVKIKLCILLTVLHFCIKKSAERDDICSNLAKGYSNLIRNVQCYKFTELYCGNRSWKIQFWKCNKQNPKLVDNLAHVLRISSVLEAITQKISRPSRQLRIKPLCSLSQIILSRPCSWPSWGPATFRFFSSPYPIPPYPFPTLSLEQWVLNPS